MQQPGISANNSSQKDQGQSGLGFFDLPAELRNSIYQCASESWTNQKLHMIEYSLNPVAIAMSALPALLQASSQLSDEAGAFFFTNRAFDISLNGCHIDHFTEWLKHIGKPNRTRLFSNPHVKINLIHPHMLGNENLANHKSGELTGSKFISLITGFDLYRRVDTRAALALAGWSFTFEHDGTSCIQWPCTWPDGVFQMRHNTSAWAIFDKCDVEKHSRQEKHSGLVMLKRLLEGIFAVHGDRRS